MKIKILKKGANMKATSILTVIISIILTSCITTGPIKYGDATKGNCAYRSIDSKEYKLSDLCKKYVTNYFFYDPNVEIMYQRNINAYKALQNQNFKILKTGVVSVDNMAKKTRLPIFRYSDQELGGDLYKLDNSFSTMVLTEDCTIFYFQLSLVSGANRTSVVSVDGTAIMDDDILKLIGTQPLEKLTLKASVEYDRFEKVFKVATPMYKDILIRGSIKANDQSVSYIQLYLDLLFLNEWGFISNAIDTDSNRHDVTKISSDTNSHDFGISLTETIGVSLDRDFLEKHADGFELKVFGAQEKIIKVHGLMVKSFLQGLDSAILQAKNN
jgi:hypothetical protein